MGSFNYVWPCTSQGRTVCVCAALDSIDHKAVMNEVFTWASK